MRIISKFKDYYDGLQNMMENLKIFIIEPKKTEILNPYIFPYLPHSQLNQFLKLTMKQW